MLIYFLRRAASTIGTLWLAFTAVFCALRALPGDVIREQLALSGASDAQIAERRAQLGLDQPLVVQYMNALLGVLHGDLGVSIGAGRSRPCTASDARRRRQYGPHPPQQTVAQYPLMIERRR